MSIADHFEQAADARCIRDYDAGAARRQFHMSLMLVLAFAAVALVLGAIVRFDTPSSQPQTASTFGVAPPAYAGRL